MTPVSIEAIRNCLAAASTAPSLRLRALHLAVARNIYAKLAEEMGSLRLVLVAQETDLVRVATPAQLALETETTR